MLPVHIVWHHEATAKSTTQDGGMAETYICGRKLRLMHLYRSVDVSTERISRLIAEQTGFNWGKLHMFRITPKLLELFHTRTISQLWISAVKWHFNVNYRRPYLVVTLAEASLLS